MQPDVDPQRAEPTASNDELKPAEADAPSDAMSGASTADASADTEPDEATQLSSAALMLLGVFGGLALLYTWGWLEIARAYSLVNENTATGSGVIGGILQQIIFWVAPLAPVAWLLVALMMTRGRGATHLALALAIGAVVTLPYPMIVGGAA